MPLASRHGAATALLAILLLGGGGAALTGPPEPVEYTLSFPEAHRHLLDVEMRVPGATGGALELRMSRSSPGRYVLHDFASHVSSLEAFGHDGARLHVTRRGPNAWSVGAAGTPVLVRYRVSGNRLDGTYLAVDATHAHINVPAALVWAEGHELTPVVVRIQPPAGQSWRVATQLFATGEPFTFTAPNLHYLVDSPIEVSDHVRRSFTADLPPGSAGPSPSIELALHHTGSDADADRYLEGLRRIVREQAAVFGEYPAYEGGVYTFIADYLPWAAPDGMEHRNSAVMTNGALLASSHATLLALAAHEFFHGWNVERIRPRSLEPFNLLDVNPSEELWLAEGVTSYYEWLTMARTGLWPLDRTLQSISRAVSTLLTLPDDARRSAVDTSLLASLYDGARPRRDADAFRVSHYTHGAVLALGFDLALREKTEGRGSLDDLMRALWRRHGREPGPHPGLVGRPYTLDDVRDCLEEVSGDGGFADALMERYVRGREVMDYERLLSLAGLRLRPAASTFPEKPGGTGRRSRSSAAGAMQSAAAAIALDDHQQLEIVPVELTGDDLSAAQAAFRENWLRPLYPDDAGSAVER